MKLLTKKVLKDLPPLYTTNGKGMDAVAVVKFFMPDGGMTWYATEGSKCCPEHAYFDCEVCPDPESWTDFYFHGMVAPGDYYPEVGYFTLNQLKSVRGSFGLPVERDMYWRPKPLKECE